MNDMNARRREPHFLLFSFFSWKKYGATIFFFLLRHRQYILSGNLSMTASVAIAVVAIAVRSRRLRWRYRRCRQCRFRRRFRRCRRRLH